MDWFKKYKEGLSLGGRYESIEMTLVELLKRKDNQGVIVETGTTRLPDDWGAGMATLVFGDFCKEHNFHLFTVDNDSNAIEIAKEVTKEFAVFTTYVVNDSIAFLQRFDQPIDLLYLDSMDCPEYDSPTSPQLIASQIHQELELKAAWSKLSKDPVILLDDNQFANGGKTKLAKVLLKERGFKELDTVSGKQSLWIRGGDESGR